MKKIECYIQPYNLDTVAEHLVVEGVRGGLALPVGDHGAALAQAGLDPDDTRVEAPQAR